MLKARGMAVHLIPLPKIRRLAGVNGALKSLAGTIRKEDAALIHSNSIRTHIYGALAADAARIPVVWHERNLITRELLDPDRILSFLPYAIICNSRAIARRFERRGHLPGKVHVIHNGVDTDIFNPSVSPETFRRRSGIDPGAVVVGIASRFNPDKGHETFFAAAGMLMRQLSGRPGSVKFLVAGGAVFGEDRYREELLKDMAASSAIRDDVIFTGVQSGMPDIYAAMDIVVLASDAEPCGRVISEAMAMGKPVIATDSGGTPEMVSDGLTGILVPPRDAAGMAAAMSELVTDAGKRSSMGHRARKAAEELFDINTTTRKTEDIYNALLAERRPDGSG